MLGKRNARTWQQEMRGVLVTERLVETLKALTFALENGGETTPELDAKIQELNTLINGERQQPTTP